MIAIKRHPLATYFAIVYVIAWGGGALVEGPSLARGQTVPALDALLLFPVLILSVCLTGILLTGVTAGRAGLGVLFRRVARWRANIAWYTAALLIPPVLILLVLFALRTLVSPVYTPNWFWLGIVFGVPPGLLEEIGWMGFAFPRMAQGRSAAAAAVVLGVLWGFWHLPVVDGLGAASPHGAYWLPFLLAFVALVAAMRVLIAWIYTNTGSLLLAQLMHTSSTACLALLGPGAVTPAQEALWYAVYAAVLWLAVALVVRVYGAGLKRT